MTGKELLNTKISYYSNAKYSISYKDISIIEWIGKYALRNKDTILKIREICTYDKKTAKEMKLYSLPAVTISGVFHSYRRIDQVTKLNPVIAIDIDKNDNEHIEDWEELKRKIASLPYVFLTSYSCSGKGLYCLIYYNIDLDFNNMFNALETDFKEMNINIDKNCKDITRLRFISYDDNILIRQGNVEMYNKEKEITIPHYKEHKDTKMSETDEFIYKSIYYLIIEDKYRANTYDTWLHNGFLLGTFGEKGLVLFLLLSQLSENYNKSEAIKKFIECQNKTRYTKSSLAFYFGILKEKHGKNWKSVVENYVI